MSRFAVGSRRWVRRYRAGLTVGSAAALVIAFAVLLLRGAAWLYGPGLHALKPDQQVTAIDDVRGRMLQFGAGLLAAGALVYTARTFRLSREGHVTDRYTKAIEQLGSEALDVRLGAIYALERIMIDSARDHPTIVEVLAAYVREHSPVVAREDRAPDVGLSSPATDVQAVLTVLGRRPDREERGKLNLRYTDLTRAELIGADLARAILNGAKLPYANLIDANLAGANLAGADLTNAYLSGADLNNANLAGAHLVGANLADSDLSDTYLGNANLASANLASASLPRAKLPHANLTNATLPRADLTGADLTSADLTSADLTRAKLPRAKLPHADLSGAKLLHADLAIANLAEAILNGADLTGARLADAVLPVGYAEST